MRIKWSGNEPKASLTPCNPDPCPTKFPCFHNNLAISFEDFQQINQELKGKLRQELRGEMEARIRLEIQQEVKAAYQAKLASLD